jgi:hypothetical protein
VYVSALICHVNKVFTRPGEFGGATDQSVNIYFVIGELDATIQWLERTTWRSYAIAHAHPFNLIVA